MQFARESLIKLITETATNLPPDVRQAMGAALKEETPATQSSLALNVIASNIDMAQEDEGPICQDTGMPAFFVKTPVGFNQIKFREDIRQAIVETTKRGKLRPNSVDPITGKSASDNLGPGTPIIHFDQWEKDDVEVRLILKGGGCENTNSQYSVPCNLDHLGRADRNLEGIRKCILHGVWQAQGRGCAPGAIGVCVGGDRTSGYEHAKLQLFRPLDDTNPDPVLAKLEQEIMDEANKLGVGTMGFGGKVSLIGCKIEKLNRLPASFFVSVAYDCWAFRRLGVLLDAQSGAIKQWLYRDPAREVEKLAKGEGFPLTGREVILEPPLTEEKVRSLKVGDVVLINGTIVTGRDEAHAYLLKNPSPVNLNGAILYHCGPVALKQGETWKINAAGPTTSMREEPYEADIIKKFGIRAVMGKGGMGKKTLEALQAHGAVYLNAIGGAAQYYARAIKKVEGVSLLELGVPEAMWQLRVKDLMALVTMDAHGNSLHADVEKVTGEALEAIGAAIPSSH
ncbi:MAG: fumarate hydratase [Acidobacteria bacterium]|nr:fumarate hydratase [Acidobacteriota bacterium]